MATTKLINEEPNLFLVKSLHERWVFRRRVRILSDLLAQLVPEGAKVLDVGCGNGMVAHLLKQLKPTVDIEGLEVMPRPSCLIKCQSFDGATIPLPNASVDVCMFIDVLHHTSDIEGMLKEARRVARRHVLIKDHLCQNRFDLATLSFMDWVGNRAYGVGLPYNYKSKAQWDRLFADCGLRCTHWDKGVRLYPQPLNSVFGRGLHFVGLFETA